MAQKKEMHEEELMSPLLAVGFLRKTMGVSVHESTVRRWIDVGVEGVFLENLSAGKKILTSKEAIIRFMNRKKEGK